VSQRVEQRVEEGHPVNVADRADDRSQRGQPVERYEVVVVGAGQAGLALGRELALTGRRFLIVDAASGVGAAWRERWDSLVLFTPRRYSGLPGLPFPGDPDGYPTRDEVVGYLERYASTLDLPIRLETRVRSLRSNGEGGFLVELGSGVLEADAVVVATGPFQAPFVPDVAAGLGREVAQLHSTAYRRPTDVPPGRVLVVGGGNTGFQLAKELAASHDVSLAVGTRQTPLPQRFLGRDLFWWLTKTGILDKTVETRLGRRARGRDTLIGSSPRALERRHAVALRPRVVKAEGRTVGFADGSQSEVDAVVWATGYRADHSWIELPVFGDDARLVHRRGVTDVPGLFFLGLSWQHTRGSALIGFVGDDAAFVAGRVAAHLGDVPAQSSAETSSEPAPLPAGAGEGT
jgi:putative flavoprotein involved in K+ transport